MKRVTIAYFTWDWQYLGQRAVSLTDKVIADKHLTHCFIIGLLRSVVPNPPADVHSAMLDGDVAEHDILAAVEQLKTAHGNGSIRKTESWEGR